LYFYRGFPFKDDAYIFYRYAANWASGYGPVFNVGEFVQGFSSLLWTVILAKGAALSFDLVKFAPVLNFFICIASLVLISFMSDLIPFSRKNFYAFILPILCALSYGFYYYAASGMDTILFSFVLIISIIALTKIQERGIFLISSFFFFLIAIARAEGFLYSIILLSVMTLFSFLEKDRKKNTKNLLLTIFLTLFLLIMIFVVRYNYFGEWMPAPVMAKGYATYLIKTSILNGDIEALGNFIRVILGGLRYESFLIYTGAWLPFAVLLWKRCNNILIWFIASSIAVNVFVTTWAGGDYMPYKRHFVAVLPLLIVFVAWSLDLLFFTYWKRTKFVKSVLTGLAIFIIFAWMIFFVKPKIFFKQYAESGRSLYLRQLGMLLNEMPSETVLLSSMIGKISYYAGPDVYVRDILGLTDIHNAKYGETFGLIAEGGGVCGRTDFDYSFSSHFDIFFYNSFNMHKNFVLFCENNPSICNKYRFFSKDEWIESGSYVIANINHPISTAIERKFGAVPLRINESLEDILRPH
jgi:hypothetical protein